MHRLVIEGEGLRGMGISIFLHRLPRGLLVGLFLMIGLAFGQNAQQICPPTEATLLRYEHLAGLNGDPFASVVTGYNGCVIPRYILRAAADGYIGYARTATGYAAIYTGNSNTGYNFNVTAWYCRTRPPNGAGQIEIEIGPVEGFSYGRSAWVTSRDLAPLFDLDSAVAYFPQKSVHDVVRGCFALMIGIEGLRNRVANLLSNPPPPPSGGNNGPGGGGGSRRVRRRAQSG